VVFAIAGNITAKQLDRIIDRYLLPQQLKAGDRQRELPPPYQPQQQQQQISTQQAHQILGGRAYALPKEDYFAFTLLMNMLGGPAMNSRLNLNIREKFGLTYSIHSFYNPFLDSGLWGIYYACDEKNLDRVRKLILKEFKSLREKPIGSLRLHQMKKQLIGQYTLSHEHLLGQMLALAKDVLDFGHILPFSTYVNRMESLQAEDLLRVSNEQFVPDQFSEIRFSPS
jgi:predicted Zn-dependent peptidase